MAATWTKTGARSVTSTQAANEAAPVDGAQDGINLWGVGAIRCVFTCDAGQTFTGTGGFDAYSADRVASLWSSHPDADVDCDAGWNGKRSVAVALTVSHPDGRFALIANSVGVSGGGLTVAMEATEINGRRV